MSVAILPTENTRLEKAARHAEKKKWHTRRAERELAELKKYPYIIRGSGTSGKSTWHEMKSTVKFLSYAESLSDKSAKLKVVSYKMLIADLKYYGEMHKSKITSGAIRNLEKLISALENERTSLISPHNLEDAEKFQVALNGILELIRPGICSDSIDACLSDRFAFTKKID